MLELKSVLKDTMPEFGSMYFIMKIDYITLLCSYCRELSNVRKQFTSERATSNIQKPNNTEQACTESEQESDVDSNASSALQWQDDPEFQNKVE